VRPANGIDEATRGELERIAAALERPPLSDAVAALRQRRPAQAEALLRPYLEARPDEAGALWLLASALGLLGRWDEAEAPLRRALASAPSFLAARSDLVRVLHQERRLREALEEVEALLASAPDDPTGLALAAALFVDTGRTREALAVTERLLTRSPDEAGLRMSYGHLLKTVGRTDEAVAAYREALRLRPSAGILWWSLANLKTVALSEEDMGQVRRLLADRSLAPYDRLHLHFALGKALADAGRPAEAFEQYAAGNRVRRALAPHNADAVTRYVARCEALFTPGFFAARQGQGSPAPDPIFILGMPRSGSTLVEQILAGHPEVEGTMELPDLPHLADRVARRAGGYPDALADLDAGELRALGEAYLEATRLQRRTDKPFFIDKLPANWRHIGLVHLILPQAKIVDVRRHPLACGVSLFAQQFERGQEFAYDLADIGAYYRDYVRLMAHFDRVLPGRVHRLVYERLVEAPEDEVRRLLDHLGLPFDPACLAFHETRRDVHTPSAEQVRRPINREGLERWRDFEPWLDPLRQALGPVLDAYPDAPES
jgi:tetratricopeptide (TPR) repeat protein